MLLDRFYIIATGIRQQNKKRQPQPQKHGELTNNDTTVCDRTGSIQNDGTASPNNDSTTKKQKVQVIKWNDISSNSIVTSFIRIVLMDIPLLVLFLLYASCQWIDHVRTQYLFEQIQLLTFTTKRANDEITYYQRPCTIDDITTFDGTDLFLQENATVQEAYEHNLKHGFTVFRNVLQPQTAYNLRQYIDDKNYKIREQDKIFVIEGMNRYSFGLGTEEPTVAAAVKEVATSTILRPALEAIIGPNPALIEMTAITSSYGAVDQYWHDDVIAAGSAINYARTFGPSYSVFIQLQNTTRTMGATGVCPGTHYCSDGGIDVLCDTTKAGFQLVNKYNVPATTTRNTSMMMDSVGNSSSNDNDDTNQYEYWHEGDALLMNMNSFHRGSAHTDPYAIDRVMFILTFVPSPMDHSETRQLSQGITFSLRWDMWGHTLYDLQYSDTIMKQPWSTLRALGLYKVSNAPTWGIDYITSACMRMANSDNGFRKVDLIKWINWGGFPYLPTFLEGQIDVNDDDESWYEYYSRTLINVIQFLQKCCCIGIGLYLMITIMLTQLTNPYHNKNNPTTRKTVVIWNAIVRITMFVCIVTMIFLYTKQHVDETTWANDIRSQRRYGSTTSIEEMIFYNDTPIQDYSVSVSTFPTRHDVLIETRYGSEQLALYNDYINGHPGNRYFDEIVSNQINAITTTTTTTTTKTSAANEATATFGTYPSFYQTAVAQWIVNMIVTKSYGRFLYQNPNGCWLWISNDDSVLYTKTVLAKYSYPTVRIVLQQLRFLTSEYKYGTYRNTVLGTKYSVQYLRMLEMKILNQSINRYDRNNNNADATTSSTNMMLRPVQSQTPSRIQNEHSTLSSSSMLLSHRRIKIIIGGGGRTNIGPTSLKHRNQLTRLLDASLLSLFTMLETAEEEEEEKAVMNDVDSDLVQQQLVQRQQQQLLLSMQSSGAWLSEGDMAEGYENEYWYIGRIEIVTAHGDYRMVYPSGGRDTIDRYTIRPFVSFVLNEHIQYYVNRQHQYYNATIVYVSDRTEEVEVEEDDYDEPFLRVYVPQLDRTFDVQRLDEIRRAGQLKETKVEYHRAY